MKEVSIEGRAAVIVREVCAGNNCVFASDLGCTVMSSHDVVETLGEGGTGQCDSAIVASPINPRKVILGSIDINDDFVPSHVPEVPAWQLEDID